MNHFILSKPNPSKGINNRDIYITIPFTTLRIYMAYANEKGKRKKYYLLHLYLYLYLFTIISKQRGNII